jgi:voltage-gated potassium channel
MKRIVHLVHKQLTILQKLEIEFLLLLVLISSGVVVMNHYEWLHRFDALYFSIITLAGIGYGDIVPMTIYGKILAMVYGIAWIPLFVIAWSLIVEILKNEKE